MTTILIKKKDTAGAPAAGDLTNAAGGTEIAVNTATKRIYTKDAAGNVVELGTNASAMVVASLTDTGLTSGRVTYATTGGLLTDSANLLYAGADLTVYGVTIGRGAGSVASNTALGASALVVNSSGTNSVAVGSSALWSQTTATGNTGVGFTAGYYLSSGSFNTAVGSRAMQGVSATPLTGSDNVAVGAWHDGVIEGPLGYLTSGSRNIGIGVAAGRIISTGVNNVAMGYSALQAATVANNNTAIGAYALNNNTGNWNTAVGYEAAYSNSTVGDTNAITVVGYQAAKNINGARNITAVGYQAAYGLSTGDNNTFVGWYSGGASAGITGTANAGIGSSTLTYLTSGVGNAALGNGGLFTLTTGSYNVAAGSNAGYVILTGSSNIAIGSNALGTLSTGSENTAVGHNAGYNYKGSALTAFGFQALFNATTTTAMTAVGYQALFNATTAGASSTAVGYQAGVNITSGSGSAFFGFSAGKNVTTGISNTGIGYRNMEGNGVTGSGNTSVGGWHDSVVEAPFSVLTSGSFNSAFAPGALKGLISGNYNTVMGHSAMVALTTGSNNTAFGYAALQSTTGGNNTAVGYQALYTNAGSNQGTALGYRAGFGSTGGSNIHIGFDSGYASGGGSFNTVVGLQAGYNATGNRNVFIGFDAGFSTTGSRNTFVGGSNTGNEGAGYYVTSGNANTIIGNYTGSGAPISATGSNYIVVSDGDGNARQVWDNTGGTSLGGTAPLNVSSIRGYELGTGGAAYHGNGSRSYLSANAYWNNSQWTRVNASPAVQAVLDHNSGTFIVSSAVTGTAGSAVSFINVVEVNANSTLALQGANTTSGTGITFPATQNNSSNANTLDDYEEGNWTPIIAAGSGSITSYTSTGSYTKVGRLVTLTGFLSITDNGTGGAYGIIAGFPFSSAVGQQFNSAGIGRNGGTNGYTNNLNMSPNDNQVQVWTYANAYPWANSASLQFSISYNAAT